MTEAAVESHSSSNNHDNPDESRRSLEELPYVSLQIIASFLDIDTRYALSSCSLQLLDAVDTDLVWYLASPEKMNQFVPRIEAPLPRYRKMTSISPEAREARIQHLMAILNQRLPTSRICATSELHNRFRVLAVEAAIPRTILFLENDIGGFDLDGESQLSNPVKFLLGGFGQNNRNMDLADQAGDVFGPNAIRGAFAAATRASLVKAKKLAADRAANDASPSRSTSLVEFLPSAVASAAPSATPAAAVPAAAASAAPACNVIISFRSRPPSQRRQHSDLLFHDDGEVIGDTHKWLQRWCLEVNQHAHEIARGVHSLTDLRASVQLVAIANMGSAAIYLYLAVISGISRGFVRVLHSFPWSRRYFARHLAEGTLQSISWHEFLNFPHLASSMRLQVAEDMRAFFAEQRALPADKACEMRMTAFRHLLGVRKTEEILAMNPNTAAESIYCQTPALRSAEQHEELVRAVAATATSALSTLINPRLSGQGQGLPAFPVWVLVANAFITGSAASYLGGRTPSLHRVPPAFALRFNFPFKVLFDILRTTVHHNLDALLFFAWDRIFFLGDALASLARYYTTASAPARLLRGAVNTALFGPFRFFVPSAIRDRIANAVGAMSLAHQALVTQPLAKFVIDPLARARDSSIDALFGQMSAPAIMGFLSSTAISVCASCIYETERISYKRTVTARGFGVRQTMLSHAMFAASLVMLRWRLYVCGASFWRVTVVESAVRIGVSFLELAFARMSYVPLQRKSDDIDED